MHTWNSTVDVAGSAHASYTAFTLKLRWNCSDGPCVHCSAEGFYTQFQEIFVCREGFRIVITINRTEAHFTCKSTVEWRFSHWYQQPFINDDNTCDAAHTHRVRANTTSQRRLCYTTRQVCQTKYRVVDSGQSARPLTSKLTN